MYNKKMLAWVCNTCGCRIPPDKPIFQAGDQDAHFCINCVGDRVDHKHWPWLRIINDGLPKPKAKSESPRND